MLQLHFPQKNRPFLLSLFVLGVSIVGFIVMIKTKPIAPPLKPQERVWNVRVSEVKLQRLPPQVLLYARIESPTHATLVAALNADVIALNTREGEIVQSEQVLVTLDRRDMDLLLKQREAELREIEARIDSENRKYAMDEKSLPHEEALFHLAEKAVARVRKLEKQQATSQSALDEALRVVEQQILALNNLRLEISNHDTRLAQLQAQLAKAQALRAQSMLDVERTTIKAPFTGVVAKTMVASGDRVRVGSEMLMLYSLESMELRAQVPFNYRHVLYDLLETEKSLYASAEVNGQHLEATLDRLAGEIQSNKGGIDAILKITKGDRHRLRLGEFVHLSLHLPPVDKVVAVPYETVYGANRVYKLVDERMHKVTVTRVGEWRTAAEEPRLLIRSDELNDGDSLIISQLPNAIHGLKVQVAP